MRYLRNAAIVGALMFFSLSALAGEGKLSSNWKKLDYDVTFSIRCSKGPRIATLGGHKQYWYDFIYLKWDGEELSRLTYSATVDAPQHWYNDEHPAIYKVMKSGGDSEITIDAKKRMYGGEELEIIEVNLDASKASELSRLNTNAVTYGKWTVSVTGGNASFTESTSNFNNGKLSFSGSSVWEACRLMTPYGDDF